MDVICNREGVIAETPAPLPPLAETSSEMSVFDAFSRGFFSEVVNRTAGLIPDAVESPQLALSLWYIRIQSLLFLHMGFKAAEEIGRCLYPVESAEFQASLDSEAQLAGFKLRLLLVPVQTKGINHVTVSRYYAMAAEARSRASEASEASNEENVVSKWLELISLCGIYALSSLIALKDYETSIELCQIHYKATNNPLYARIIALLHLVVGDSLSAREWVGRADDNGEIQALIKFCDDDSTGGNVPEFEDLYKGKISQALAEFETKALTVRNKNGSLVNANLINLFTLYNIYFSDPEGCRARFLQQLNETEPTHLESTELSAALRAAVAANQQENSN